MLFQSIPYLIFFPLVALGYFAIQAKWRWIWILLASYFFYMYWNPWYTFLIIISTLTDYIAGIKIEDSSNDSVRKKYLYLSIFINLGLLFTFKYFDFFSAQVEVIGQLFSPDFHSILRCTPFFGPRNLEFKVDRSSG
jgi:D-alanyl-lipoteichoic acid acyltransferase DltB (MBOAT superfamily)